MFYRYVFSKTYKFAFRSMHTWCDCIFTSCTTVCIISNVAPKIYNWSTILITAFDLPCFDFSSQSSLKNHTTSHWTFMSSMDWLPYERACEVVNIDMNSAKAQRINKLAHQFDAVRWNLIVNIFKFPQIVIFIIC